MNIEMLAQVFLTHCGTFTMPTGESVTPRAGPAHDMFGLCTFPQGEIGRIALLALTVQLAGGVQHIVQVAAGQFAVMMVFVVFCYIEINGTFTFISIAVFQNFFYQSICSMIWPDGMWSILGGSTFKASIALW